MSPAWAGGVFTTEPSGKPRFVFLKHHVCGHLLQQQQETNPVRTYREEFLAHSKRYTRIYITNRGGDGPSVEWAELVT